MAKWTAADDYLARVRSLTDAAFSYRLRSGETVLDDADADVLTGSDDDDWFFFDSVKDRITDAIDEVLANDSDWV